MIRHADYSQKIATVRMFNSSRGSGEIKPGLLFKLNRQFQSLLVVTALT